MRSHKSRLRRRRMAERFRRHCMQIFILTLIAALLVAAAFTVPIDSPFLTDMLEDCSQRIKQTAQAVFQAANYKLREFTAFSFAAESSNGSIAEEPLSSFVPEGTPAVSQAFIPVALFSSTKNQVPAAYFSRGEETTIEYKNTTGYTISPVDIIMETAPICLDSSGPQVLVIHTHGSEAYTPHGDDVYEESDPFRTTDNNYNMVRIGDELCSVLHQRGIQTVHDDTLYDYPNYNSSYSRSMDAIEQWLKEYPSIKVVLDLHRDAIEYTDGSIYKTSCTVDGQSSAQILIVSGTDDSGLYHPNWQQNLGFGFTLQNAMDMNYPGLTRPLKISQYRYNMHATAGSLLIEVGSHGNTLQEALVAVRCFGTVLADVLLAG